MRVMCRGAVQGVGFRPTVYRIATEMGLAGWVVNDPTGVTIEVEGSREAATGFPGRLRAALPPLARIDDMVSEEIPCRGDLEFGVRASERGRRAGALVPPDAALCDDCRREMATPSDRRYRYPFTTCTNCGPRFSLVLQLPYDRPQTAMGCFELCPDCAREYDDPTDRRFHAEPVCCPACGPRLRYLDRAGETLAEDAAALGLARQALLDGAVVAIKGLGGFQLACRADLPEPVGTLRRRKRRPTKPLAVMVRDLEAAEELVELQEADRALLLSPRCPVVLAPRRASASLAPEVAPGIADLGVMLTTTPLHVELFADPAMPVLVMTSANLSEEPICRSNREAVERLRDIADGFLLHDRDVVRRVDDSVVRSTAGGPLVLRRARGWVPEPEPLPVATPTPVLAVGGHLQATACLAVDDQAFLSQHVGDLDSESARRFLREVIHGLEDFLQVEPAVIVADAHPDYPSSWLAAELARERSGEVISVQHHLAHAAAALAEHGRFPAPGDSALALGLDGTGWGPDGTAWGGELIRLDGSLQWRRLAHLEPLPLVGGETAVREPWRVAAAALSLAGMAPETPDLPLSASADAEALARIAELAVSDSWPMASGAGRLFEAAGALLGLAAVNDWEGEAAVRLESLATDWPGRAEVWSIGGDGLGSGNTVPSVSLIAEAARRLLDGEPAPRVAASLHATFCELTAELVDRIAGGTPATVALGGGCLANRLLREGLRSRLEALGYEPMMATSVPPGDGGLSYGQAVLAAVAAARNLEFSSSPS